jgi:hypothetical protein
VKFLLWLDGKFDITTKANIWHARNIREKTKKDTQRKVSVTRRMIDVAYMRWRVNIDEDARAKRLGGRLFVLRPLNSCLRTVLSLAVLCIIDNPPNIATLHQHGV